MPTVVVETGAGVAGANAFADRATVAAYCDNRGYAWAPADNTQADRAVIRGCDWLKNMVRLIYRGSMLYPPMPWPRDGASYYRGPDIASNVVPQCVIDAQCELAYRALVTITAGTTLQPDQTRDARVKRDKVGPIETEYFADAPSETVIVAVMGILGPVLLLDGALLPEPYQTDPQSVSPYLPGEFNNPPETYTNDQTRATSGPVDS